MEKYIIGIDESGTTSGHLKRLERYKKNNFINENEKYISVTYVKISEINLKIFKSKLLSLKLKYFSNLLSLPTIHASDLFKAKNIFRSIHINDLKKFIKSLFTLLENTDFEFYSLVYNVEEHYKNYLPSFDPPDPYLKLNEEILENVFYDINRNPFSLKYEKRGENEDLEAIKFIFNACLKILVKNKILIKPPLDINFLNKKDKNIEVIELADVISYIFFAEFRDKPLSINRHLQDINLFFKKIKLSSLLRNRNKMSLIISDENINNDILNKREKFN